MWKVQVVVNGRETATHDLAPGAELVVGRDPTVNIVLGERSVSRRHCRLVGGPNGVEVVDLGSANGVYVGGRAVPHALLKAGEDAQIGMVQLRIQKAATKTGMIPIQGLLNTISGRDDATSGGSDSAKSILDPGKHAYKGLEKERLALLIEAGKSLSAAVELDQLFDRIMDHLFQILPVKRAVLALLEPDGSLSARHLRPAGEVRELSEVCSQHILRQVIEAGTPQFIEDASLDQRFNMAHSILAANIKAAICAPLVSHARPLGALYADYPGRARLYTPNDLEFFGAFASLAAVALENSRMQAELRERERLQRDLEIAAEIQKGLLPDATLEVPGVEMDWAYWPAKKVGGDFYDCVSVDGDRVAVVLGDVSGKSLGAAMFMARLTSFLRATIPDNPLPGQVLTRVNALLGTRSDTVIFATACYLLLEPSARRIQWASAGHWPVLILNPDSADFEELGPTGFPLGIEPEAIYVGREQALAPGALLVLYTDGIVEARNTAGAMFGVEELRRIIHKDRHAPVREITKSLIEAVDFHCRGSPYLRDDIALFVIRTGNPSPVTA